MQVKGKDSSPFRYDIKLSKQVIWEERQTSCLFFTIPQSKQAVKVSYVDIIVNPYGVAGLRYRYMVRKDC